MKALVLSILFLSSNSYAIFGFHFTSISYNCKNGVCTKKECKNGECIETTDSRSGIFKDAESIEKPQELIDKELLETLFYYVDDLEDFQAQEVLSAHNQNELDESIYRTLRYYNIDHVDAIEVAKLDFLNQLDESTYRGLRYYDISHEYSVIVSTEAKAGRIDSSKYKSERYYGLSHEESMMKAKI